MATTAPITSVRARFQSGVVFNVVGAVFNQGSTFAFNIIAARILGRETFGQYAILCTTIAMVGQVSQLGCGITATKFIAEFRASDKERAGRIFGTLRWFVSIAAAVGALGLILCSPWLADSVLRASRLTVPLVLAAGVILFNTLNSVLMGALAGVEAFAALCKALVWSGISYLAICTASAWYFGLEGAIVGLFASACVQWLLLHRAATAQFARNEIPFNVRWNRSERKVLTRFALPASLNGLTALPALWIGTMFLARRPDGFSQVALYGASFSLMTIVLFLPSIVNNVAVSILNYHRRTTDPAPYRATYWLNIIAVVVISVIGALVIGIAGPPLLRVFGKSFAQGYPVLIVLLTAAVIQATAIGVYQQIQSDGRMWLSFFAVALPRDILTVVLAKLLISHYGAEGLAGSYLAGWTLCLAVILVIVFAAKGRTHLGTPQEWGVSQYV